MNISRRKRLMLKIMMQKRSVMKVLIKKMSVRKISMKTSGIGGSSGMEVCLYIPVIS